MKIYVVGSSKNKFLPLDNIREKFLIDQPHEGDNIDFLNPWYCELTGLYYLWKHVDDDIVGLEHYRRYFVNDKGNLFSEGEIREILKDYDVICHESDNNINSFWYKCRKQKISFLEKFLPIIKAYDGESAYLIFKNYLNESTYIQNNMCICKKEVFNEYCEWLFERLDVYFKGSKKFNFLNPRLIGYIAEYFFGAYLKYKRYKIHKTKQAFIDKKIGIR